MLLMPGWDCSPCGRATPATAAAAAACGVFFSVPAATAGLMLCALLPAVLLRHNVSSSYRCRYLLATATMRQLQLLPGCLANGWQAPADALALAI
jgi:hypothetical protein